MATDVQHGAVHDYIYGENEGVIQDIAQSLLCKESTILSVVETLGPHLTNSEKHVRGRSTRLLAELLHRLPTDFLSSKEVEVLLSFFCDRIKDHHSVTPHVLTGLQALTHMPALSDSGVKQMLTSVFTEVHVQSLNQADRRQVYNIIAHFLATKLTVLQSMPDLVLNYIQAMDAEKDPRNLLICFSTITILAQHFPIGPFAEELFEVVACYFPIDFTPPANDPHGITKQDLIQALRTCLASTPKFAEFCVPLLIEKLTSSVPSAKIDSLLTLAACAPTYGQDGLKEYLPSLIFNIRREVFSATDQELEEAALVAIKAITEALSHQISQKGQQTTLGTFLDDLYKECERHLCEPELKLMYPSAKVLQAAAGASDPASSHILAKVLPLMLKQYHAHPQVALRKNIVDIMLGFMRVSKNTSKATEVFCPIHKHKDEVFGILVSLLSSSDVQLRRLALQGMLLFGVIPRLMDDDGRGLVATHITKTLLQDSEDAVRREAVCNLAELSQHHPRVVQDQLDTVIANIIAEPMEVNGTGDGGSFVVSKEFLLEALSSVATDPQLVEHILPKLMTHLEHLSVETCTSSEGHIEVLLAACRCICDIVRNSVQTMEKYLEENVLYKCISLSIRGAMDTGEHSVLSHIDIVESLATIIRTIVQSMSNCSELASSICHLFLEGDLSVVSVENNSCHFKPFEVSSSRRQTQCVSILQAVLCSIPQQTVVPSMEDVMKGVWRLALHSPHGHSYNTAMKCYAGLLNKTQPDAEASLLADKCRTELLPLLEDSSSDQEMRMRVLQLWCWLAKALILRGSPSQGAFQEQILTRLKDPSLGAVAADGFRVILEECEDVMNIAQKANIRLMYKQRFFMTTQQKLVQGYTQAEYDALLTFVARASADVKRFYLTALSHYLKFVPKDVLKGELPNLLPLLVQSLSYDDVELRLGTTSTMTDLLHQDPQLLASHLDDILPRMLAMATYKPNMKVRLSALQCLGLLSSLPRPLIYPHQSRVVHTIGSCLNDHKRLVRKAAADARMQWFLLETKK